MLNALSSSPDPVEAGHYEEVQLNNASAC
jgi:hypothetical protein